MLEITPLNLQLNHDLKPEKFTCFNKKVELKVVSALEYSRLLLKNSYIKLLNKLPDINSFYIYNRKKGSYKRLTRYDLKICISSLLATVAKG